MSPVHGADISESPSNQLGQYFGETTKTAFEGHQQPQTETTAGTKTRTFSGSIFKNDNSYK